MEYEKTVPFAGDIQKVLETARNAFIQQSFHILHNSETALELFNTGSMWTRGQHPLVGISKISFRISGGNLTIEAELGGVRKTIKYMILFLIGMAVFFLIIFGIIFPRQGYSAGRIILHSLIPFAPWPIIIPLMTKFFKYRSCKALDVLLENMVILGKEN